MNRSPLALATVVAATLAFAGCGDRNAGATGTGTVPTEETAPPPIDPAVPGAPEGVLPAPASTAPMLPATDPTTAHFEKLDADGNGRVTADEHAQGAAAMFEAMDRNADGIVTAAEMDAAGGDARLSSADKIKAVDANGDGVLAATEHAAGSRTMFATMDTGGDGTLDVAEVRAGHDRLMGGGASTQ